jgi:hypothetical protein
MLTFMRSRPWITAACAGLIFITWIDVLDEVATLVLLQQPGYIEANPIAQAFGVPALVAIKFTVPIVLGLLLLFLYRPRPVLFRVVTLILWCAIPFYVAVVAHNVQLIMAR